jgi:predicted DNA-binding protein with PD1-like motif
LDGKVGRICFYRLLEGEDLLIGIQERVIQSGMKSGFFMTIGALSSAVFGLYHAGQYKEIKADGPLEIAACMGDVAVNEASEVVVHAHLVVSNEKGEASGGHLMKGCAIDPTAELIVIEALDISLVRAYDEKTKLNLLKLT